MPDISMCEDDKCPRRVDCFRFTATPDKYGQYYGDFKWGKYNEHKKGCDFFWDMKK